MVSRVQLAIYKHCTTMLQIQIDINNLSLSSTNNFSGYGMQVGSNSWG